MRVRSAATSHLSRPVAPGYVAVGDAASTYDPLSAMGIVKALLSGGQAVPVQSGTTLVAGRPQVLFEFPMFVAPGGRPYDITPDGRFVIIRAAEPEPGGGTASNMILVLNWFEELKGRVPAH